MIVITCNTNEEFCIYEREWGEGHERGTWERGMQADTGTFNRPPQLLHWWTLNSTMVPGVTTQTTGRLNGKPEWMKMCTQKEVWIRGITCGGIIFSLSYALVNYASLLIMSHLSSRLGNIISLYRTFFIDDPVPTHMGYMLGSTCILVSYFLNPLLFSTVRYCIFKYVCIFSIVRTLLKG